MRDLMDDPRWRWRSDMDAQPPGLLAPKPASGGPNGLGYPAGGDVARPYTPNILDEAARLVTNGQDGPAARAAEVVLGTRGLGQTGYPSIGGILGANGAAKAGQELYDGNYGSAALHGAEAIINPLLAGRIGPMATSALMKPSPISGRFDVPFTAKGGSTGSMQGYVEGKTAEISKAFMDSRGTTGDVGAREILRAVRELKQKYPAVDRVTAGRIQNKYGNAQRHIDMAITPEWKRGLQDLPAWLRP